MEMNTETRTDLTVPTGMSLPQGRRRQMMGQLARLVAQLTCPGCWQGLSTHRSGQCSSLWGQAPSCVALSALVFPVGPARSYTSPTHTHTHTHTRTHAPLSWSQLTAPVAAASKPVTLISLPSSSDRGPQPPPRQLPPFIHLHSADFPQHLVLPPPPSYSLPVIVLDSVLLRPQHLVSMDSVPSLPSFLLPP